MHGFRRGECGVRQFLLNVMSHRLLYLLPSEIRKALQFDEFLIIEAFGVKHLRIIMFGHVLKADFVSRELALLHRSTRGVDISFGMFFSKRLESGVKIDAFPLVTLDMDMPIWGLFKNHKATLVK